VTDIEKLAALYREIEKLKRAVRDRDMAAPLYEEHGSLVDRLFTVGLSDDEKKRLDFVREQLSALETLRMSQWERMADLVQFQKDCFAAILELTRREEMVPRPSKAPCTGCSARDYQIKAAVETITRLRDALGAVPTDERRLEGAQHHNSAQSAHSYGARRSDDGAQHGSGETAHTCPERRASNFAGCAACRAAFLEAAEHDARPDLIMVRAIADIAERGRSEKP
jgi:hypothetical protein